MFGSLGVPELLLIFAVILIVFGPRRIPEIGRTLGKALSEFRKATDDIKSTIEREVRLEELKQIAPTVVTPFESISRSEPWNPAAPDVPATDSSQDGSSGSSGFLGSSEDVVTEPSASEELRGTEEPRGTEELRPVEPVTPRTAE